MARILIQTDDGHTVRTIDFPVGCTYATYLIPSCLANAVINTLLAQLARGLEDAEAVQKGIFDPHKLSERVMDSLREGEN